MSGQSKKSRRQVPQGAGAGQRVKGASCADGQCPVRKNAWLIAACVYGGWLLFLVVLSVRQMMG